MTLFGRCKGPSRIIQLLREIDGIVDALELGVLEVCERESKILDQIAALEEERESLQYVRTKANDLIHNLRSLVGTPVS